MGIFGPKTTVKDTSPALVPSRLRYRLGLHLIPPPPRSAGHDTHVCTSRDLANPLAELYPKNATGVLNATLVIIPVPLETARRLIPPQHGILERAYRTLLPNFPDGMYPFMMQAAHDHDVQFRAYGFTLDDFSVSVSVGQTCTWYCAD